MSTKETATRSWQQAKYIVLPQHNIQAKTFYTKYDTFHLYIIKFARELVDPSWSCALFCLSFLVHIIRGSCMGRMCHFSCGVNINVTNLIGNGLLKTSDSLTTNIYLNPLHVVFLQFILL